MMGLGERERSGREAEGPQLSELWSPSQVFWQCYKFGKHCVLCGRTGGVECVRISISEPVKSTGVRKHLSLTQCFPN